MVALGRWFVYGNIWVAICATALAWLSYFESGFRPQVEFLLFVFFSTLIVYNMNMISGLESLKEKGTESERHIWCIANAGLLKISTLIGLLGASYCFALLSLETWFVLAPFGLAAVLYVVPLIGKRGSGVRLREFGLNKIFTIAIVWAMVTVVLPLVNSAGTEILGQSDFWSKALARAMFIFAITLPFDIRDLKNDRKINVRTLPMILGVKKTLRLSVATLLVYAAMYVLLSDVNWLILGHLAGVLLTVLLVLMTNERRSDMFYSFTLEGTMVLLTLCVYGASLLF